MSRSAIRSTSPRSTRPSPSSSTASIRSAPGRSVFRCRAEFSHHGKPDYTSYLTFNDDVAAENIDFLIKCYQALGDRRLLDPITRGMNAFLVTQQGQPQPGWALQYTPDLKPVGARTYEPDALVTHTSSRNIELLIEFYRLTGDTKFLARVPEAIDWLDRLTLPAGVAPRGRTHPTFIEIGTNKPLYVHREGSNVVNGRYFVNDDSANTLAHYSAFRAVDVADLRKRYADAKVRPRRRSWRSSRRCRPGRAHAAAALLRGGYRREGLRGERDRGAQRGRLLAGAARLQQSSLQGRRTEDRPARRLLARRTWATRPTRRRIPTTS